MTMQCLELCSGPACNGTDCNQHYRQEPFAFRRCRHVTKRSSSDAAASMHSGKRLYVGTWSLAGPRQRRRVQTAQS